MIKKLIFPMIALLCLGSASAAPEAVQDLKLPAGSDPRVAREGMRITVEPRQGQLLVAKVQDFGNLELPREEDKPVRETIRIIWTGGSAWSEDIVTTYFHRVPRTKNDPPTTRAIISGFGMEFELGPMIYAGGGGGSVGVNLTGENKGASYVRRRFHFADHLSKPSQRRSIVFVLQSVDKMEAMSLAVRSGVVLPAAEGAPWSITLPPRDEDIIAEKPAPAN